MGRASVVLIGVLLSNGCALGIRPIDPGWDGTTEPVCDSDYAAVVGDAIISGVSLGIGAAAADDPRQTDEVTAAAVSGFVASLVFGVSALIGENRIGECRSAKAQWRIGGAIGLRAGQVQVRAAAHPAAGPPRGFYCAISPTVERASLCAREREGCDRLRDAAIVGVGDIGGCSLVEVVWCSERGRCSSSEAACVALNGADAACREQH